MAKTKLPKINPSRLQRTVADMEFNNEFDDFDTLCKAVAEHKWSKSHNLDAWTIGALMIQHDTIITMDKPDAMPETHTPPPAPTTTHTSHTPTVAVDATPTEIKTYDEGGRGKKQCPSCEKYVGARNAVCACGHEFKKVTSVTASPVPKHAPKSVGAAAAPVRRTVQRDEPQEYTPGRHVFCTVRQRTAIPAGACPHKLNGTDIQTVEEWAEKVRIHCQREHQSWMMLSALKYYAREFYDIFGDSDSYEIVKTNLDVLYAGESRIAMDDCDE